MSNSAGCVTIPSYEATAYNSTTELFTVPGLPTDGSVGICFITVDPAIGALSASKTQVLAVFNGVGVASNTTTGFIPTGLGAVPAYLPDGSGWNFV